MLDGIGGQFVERQTELLSRGRGHCNRRAFDLATLPDAKRGPMRREEVMKIRSLPVSLDE